MIKRQETESINLTSSEPCTSTKYVRVGREREIKVILGRQSTNCVRDLWRKSSVTQSAN